MNDLNKKLPATYLGLGQGKGLRGGPVVKPLKGAIVAVESGGTKVIRFQYNPEKLSRKVTAAFYSGGSARVEPARFSGAPAETIDLEAKFDATDGLASGDPMVKKNGIRPQLAVLELLAYPSLEQVGKKADLLKAGTVGAVTWPAATTLLIFGMGRIVPVRIMSLGVTEELFDGNLNPIRASASLSMEVISYSQVPPETELYSAHTAYQRVLERKAKAFMDQAPAGGKYAAASKTALG